MAASSSGSRALVSPVTMPGSSPPASPPNRAAAAVKARRSSPGPCCQGPGPRNRVGADVADRSPASGSPGAEGRSLPVARRSWPGTASPHVAPPMTTNRASPATLWPPKVIAVRITGTAQRSGRPPAPGILSRRGAPAISSSATTAARAATASAMAPSCRREASTAACEPAARDSNSATATVARMLRGTVCPALRPHPWPHRPLLAPRSLDGRSPERPRMTRPATKSMPPAAASAVQRPASPAGDSQFPATAVPQTRSAGSTRRRSVRRVRSIGR